MVADDLTIFYSCHRHHPKVYFTTCFAFHLIKRLTNNLKRENKNKNNTIQNEKLYKKIIVDVEKPTTENDENSQSGNDLLLIMY